MTSDKARPDVSVATNSSDQHAGYAHLIGLISPAAYEPLYGTFIVWVMLIADGSGNNTGALAGTLGVWLV